VTSVLRNGTGDYTITFTTPMSDANYSGFISSGATTASAPIETIVSFSTTQFRLNIQGRPTGNLEDSSIVSVAVFGN